MGKYSGILLCADFDNTVAVQTVVSQENADAIRYFCDNGGVFSLISGRDISFMKNYEEYLSLRSYVGCVNGTILCHLPTGKIVKETFVPDGAREILLDVLDNMKEYLQDVNIFTAQGNPLFECDEHFLDNVASLEWKNVRKFVIHTNDPFSDAHVAYVRDAFGPQYSAVRSWPRGLEVNNVSASKGKTAREIAKLVGAKLLVCAGDYENDISMLIEADTAFAVENATDSVKAVADHITVPYSDHAIAEIVKFLENR